VRGVAPHLLSGQVCDLSLFGVIQVHTLARVPHAGTANTGKRPICGSRAGADFALAIEASYF
jgi:hypothetical protein